MKMEMEKVYKDRPIKNMLTTHSELFSDCMEEMKPLNVQHYHEVSEHFKHGIPLMPDYAAYLDKEAKGELLYITLRDGGKLIGYFIGFLGHSLHYSSCRQLGMDIIFVEPTSRGQKGGVLLVNAVKAECVRRGIRVSTMGCKEAHKIYMEKMLIECGYKPFETHYSLWFED